MAEVKRFFILTRTLSWIAPLNFGAAYWNGYWHLRPLYTSHFKAKIICYEVCCSNKRCWYLVHGLCPCDVKGSGDSNKALHCKTTRGKEGQSSAGETPIARADADQRDFFPPRRATFWKGQHSRCNLLLLLTQQQSFLGFHRLPEYCCKDGALGFCCLL